MLSVQGSDWAEVAISIGNWKKQQTDKYNVNCSETTEDISHADTENKISSFNSYSSFSFGGLIAVLFASQNVTTSLSIKLLSPLGLR